ncbi:MAG: ArsR family transcriptional regulator [Anaerolineae bacterium]|nr:ArsR family transcriptional regulator [Anaerolineae bacterium]
MQPIRQHILEILKERGTATVADFGRELGMAPVSVRHHLDILQADGLIHSPGVHRKGRVGRPQQVYALTPAAGRHFPNNFRGLTNDLLDELKITLQPTRMVRMLQNIATREASEFSALAPEASLEERLDKIAEFLSERGYLARWEKANDRYLLHALNCPYAGAAESHHELCELDLTLVSQLLGVKARRVSRMAEGDNRCSFVVEVPVTAEASGI